jgi:hypothetical protein
MFARVTTYTLVPERNTPKALAALTADLETRLPTIPGLMHTYVLGGREDGRCVSVAIYKDRDAAYSSVPKTLAIWQDHINNLADEPDLQEYEVLADVPRT